MTTTSAGGKITGLLALTCTTDIALQVGDFVHLVGDYKVALADGSKPVLGHVSVRNVKRALGDDTTGSSFPVASTPGDVTVEVPGFYVKTHAADAAIAAGQPVGIGAGGDLVVDPGDGTVGHVGLALTSAAAAGTLIDVLVGA